MKGIILKIFFYNKTCNMRYLIILLWLILGIGYFWIWNNGKTNCCDEVGIAKPESGDAHIHGKAAFPLAFRWDSKLPFKGDAFDGFRDSVITSLGDDGILEITGYYNPAETNNTDESDLGIARAKEVRQLFSGIPDDRVRFKSAIIDEIAEMRDDYFVGAAFKNAADDGKYDKAHIIYFQFGTDNILNAADTDIYLNEVAEKVKGSGERILLTGHTDDVGSDQINMTVGLKRAIFVRNQLTGKGVPPEQIATESKGKTEPLVPNTNNENRAKNRRVELKIIK